MLDNTLSLFKGKVATIKKVGEGSNRERMPNGHANLVFDLIEDQ
jgi:hypothetical protein